MVEKVTWPRRIFLVADVVLLTAIAIVCIFPVIHVLALSFSSAQAASSGQVKIFPVQPTLAAYNYVAGRAAFWKALWTTLKRVLLALPISLILTIITAYPLAQKKERFYARNIYTYFFLVPMMFVGGIVPWYITIDWVGLIDTIWALVLPGVVSTFNCILLMNFIKEMPDEIDEAAQMDGASTFRILIEIVAPLCKPAIATVALFVIVTHWNAWFDGLVLMDRTENYPLQTYFQATIIRQSLTNINVKDLQKLAELSARTNRAAQIFLGIIPIVIVYPFLQRYFTKGLVLGSVKG